MQAGDAQWYVIQRGGYNLGLISSFRRNSKLRGEVTKKKGFRLSEVARCRQVDIWGKPMEDKGCFNKMCYVHYISGLRVSGDKESSCPSGTGRTPFAHEILHPAFGWKEEVRASPAPAVSQVSSAQNNLYAKVLYFKRAYYDSLQCIQGRLNGNPCYLQQEFLLLINSANAY